MVEPAPSPATGSGKQPTAGKRKPSKSTAVLPRSFKVQGDFGVAARAARPPGFDTEDVSGWSPDHWGYGGGGMKDIEHTLQMEKLRAEIEQMLNYPYALGSRGVSGTINARLVFQDHRCQWKRTRVEGASPYLRIYILALLKKLCGLETVEHLRFPDQMVVDLSFAFVITDNPDLGFQRTQAGRITGNVLLFDRTYPAANAEYQVGPIRGLWFAPVWYLDWPWVVEHWETWVEGKDPLADFRPRP